MKIININKLTALIALFIISVIFSTGAEASCRYTAAGLLDTVSGNSAATVHETTRGIRTDQCSDTPSEYELTFYKLGICTANTSANNLSSCQYILNTDGGITHRILKGTTGAMAIPKFAIEPGTYSHMVVLMSNKLGIKHSFTATNSVTGVGSSAGTSCWTSGAGPSAFTNEQFTSVHGETIDGELQLITCGTAAASAPVYSYEVINKLTGEECSDTWVAGGDYFSMGAIGNGSAEVALLNLTDGFATSCEDAAKILWTTTLTTPYVVTAKSIFQLNMRTTDSVSMDFSSGSGNNNIMKMGADPVQLFLAVDPD